MTEAKAPHSNRFNELLNLARDYMGSRIFLTALELDVFQEIGGQRLSAIQIARQIGANERALEVLLNALVSMGLLEKKDCLFENVEEVAQYVVPGHPQYHGEVFRHLGNSWETWSSLTEIIKSADSKRTAWTSDMRKDLAFTMVHQAKAKANNLARLIECYEARSMLDLGGGPGVYAIAFARCYPRLQVVIFDSDDQAKKMAEAEITAQKLNDRISYKSGDFMTDDIGKNYDLVFLSSVICLLGRKEAGFLLNKVKASLNQTGQVVIYDLLLDESKTKPFAAAMFAMHMLVNTPNGRCYPLSEIKQMLQSSGFSDLYSIPYGDFQVIVGRK